MAEQDSSVFGGLDTDARHGHSSPRSGSGEQSGAGRETRVAKRSNKTAQQSGAIKKQRYSTSTSVPPPAVQPSTSGAEAQRRSRGRPRKSTTIEKVSLTQQSQASSSLAVGSSAAERSALRHGGKSSTPSSSRHDRQQEGSDSSSLGRRSPQQRAADWYIKLSVASERLWAAAAAETTVIVGKREEAESGGQQRAKRKSTADSRERSRSKDWNTVLGSKQAEGASTSRGSAESSNAWASWSGEANSKKYSLRSGSRGVSSGANTTASLATEASSKTSKKLKLASETLGGSQSSCGGAPLLRRSARTSNTGSCASTSSQRWSRGGKLPSGGGAECGMSGSGGGSIGGGVGGASETAVGPPDGDPIQQPGSVASASSGGNATIGSSSGAAVDSESEDSEVGRLQALLEARGLPPHLFGALGPRMQHLLHRSMGGATSSCKAQQLVAGLEASGDEGQQLQAVIELCQMLVMGNEDTLAGFPIKQAVPPLIALLAMEHNLDMMNQACRALTYMMEALPRSSAAVLDAVPALLDKLQVIQCMDVAEQSLTALEMLSRRHGKAILQARGVSACLTYLDFFSINAQRAALAITSNCCQNLHADEFHLLSPSLGLLAQRLTQQDKKSVECVCIAFSRLVDSYQADPARLQQIASAELLTNLQQLLVMSPPVISTATFITVLRMLSLSCANCPELALALLRQNIAETLSYLLTGVSGSDNIPDEVELVPRSPQELYGITCLIGELMPRLPPDALLSVDWLLERSLAVASPTTTSAASCSTGRGGPTTIAWQWRDDRGLWHPYPPVDSRFIEAAHQSGEDELSLSTLGRTYTIDLHSMQQINEDTGTSRPVERRLQPPVTPNSPPPPPASTTMTMDNNANTTTVTSPLDDRENESGVRDVAASFIRSLSSVLYEVYSSSAGPSVRCKCLRALLRMVYYASPELLQEVLKSQTVSSQLAGMMASQDLRIVVGALQMADILMQKLPDVFSVHFTREGVMHEIRQLADPGVPLAQSPPKAPPPPPSSSLLAATGPANTTTGCAVPGPSGSQAVPRGAANGTVYRLLSASGGGILPLGEDDHAMMPNMADDEDSGRTFSDCSPLHRRRMREMLKQKRLPKRTSTPRSKTRGQDLAEREAVFFVDFNKQVSNLVVSGGSGGGSSSSSHSHIAPRSRLAGATSKTTSFLASLNPARWGRSQDRANFHKESREVVKCVGGGSSGGPASLGGGGGALSGGNREKARAWVRERAAKLLEAYEGRSLYSPPPPSMLARLTAAIERLDSNGEESVAALCELRDIVNGSDISPFEVNHSGLVRALLRYLTEGVAAGGGGSGPRDHRLRSFLHVFAGCPMSVKEEGSSSSIVSHQQSPAPLCMSALVSKLNLCVSQLEQFPVKVHDLPAGTGSTTALKFFNTHQLKCHLQRHPDCTSLKQWKGGTVKIDPLALVQAIERYLVVRGYARLRDKDATESDDENTEEDIDDTLAAVVISQGAARHKLQFTINDCALPYGMTVYQAVRQFSATAGGDNSETDTDTEAPLGSAHIWVQTHTVHYRPVSEEEISSSSNRAAPVPRKGKGSSSKMAPRRKHNDLWIEGVVPPVQSPLEPYLLPSLPSTVTIQDASLPVLGLLRVLHALSRFWGTLYPSLHTTPLLPQQEFVNSKVAAKASRQLHDPLVIMTGNLPAWLQQVAQACPFLLPFETRQLLLYATAFDRDRALQRLLDCSPELSSAADSTERVTPRLDRRKRTVSRDDILKQAEGVMSDMASSKALLEVQYENEVGTGLGPTLEFYALVSRELQRPDLELWEAATCAGVGSGLFPSPIGPHTKVSHVVKLRAKFRFLGKLMAKAVMDSRMLDLPLSVVFYRWLLSEESSLGLADVAHISPAVHRTLLRLQPVVRAVHAIRRDPTLSLDQRTHQLEALELDGCPIADLGLDFTLPGHASLELRKGGRYMAVTALNVEEYSKLVCHWYLVGGVQRQMDSLREGFETVFPPAQLSLFYPEELEAVFCGCGAQWDVRTLVDCCRTDHGYTPDSRAIRFLFEILATYAPQEQRDFVQFVTGSPRLPVGGFKSLSPPLTIVRKTLEAGLDPDHFLPSVMTCVNYLKLPDYTTLPVMRAKLGLAAKEGQRSFHLS